MSLSNGIITLFDRLLSRLIVNYTFCSTDKRGFHLINISKYILLLLIASACAPIVHTDFDRAFNFGNLKKYALLPAEQTNTSNMMLDGPLISKRMTQSLNDTLQANGYITSFSPDFYVGYQFGTKMEYSGGSGLGYGVGFFGNNVGLSMYNGGFLEQDEKAVLTISIYDDRKKSVLLWRGASEKTLNERSTSAKDIDKLVHEMVTVILSKFPPKNE